jgi:hypothetical protein
MTIMSRFALAVTLVAVGIGSPAFAQTAPQNDRIVIHQSTYDKIAGQRSGLHAFAMVPSSPYDPARTGGGSIGYNESLRRDQW